MSTLKDGRQFLFGEVLNDMLIKGDVRVYCLGFWESMRKIVYQQAGIDHRMPDLGEQFATGMDRLGTEGEGFPDVDAVR